MARRLFRVAALLAVLATLILLIALPSTAFAASAGQRSIDRITIADAPPGAGEDCVDDPAAHPGVGLQKCETPFSVASLLPFVAGGIVVLLVIFVAWYLVMRRRASRPFLSDEAPVTGVATPPRGAAAAVASGDWWTCRNCGSNNMIGSARCYKCGAWQR